QVYKLPEFGGGGSRSIRAIADVTAPDDRTLVIRWRALYPNANDLTSDGLPPLPRHVLEPSFPKVDAETFGNDPFWTRQFIGLGPYRLDQWEPGSFLEGVAFNQPALGKPKINRVRILFIPDPNTALAHALAGELDFIGDNAVVTEQAFTLEQEWKRSGVGTVINTPNLWRFTTFQLRPEFADPRALLDVGVRKALAHSVDRQVVAENIYHGQMAIADFLVSPDSQWGPALVGSVQAYPYDLRRTEQLMNEAGFSKGPDGTYASGGTRFAGELKTTIEREDEVTAMSSDWRKVGFDIHQAVLPAALSTDPASRATFPAMFTSTTPQGAFDSFTTAQAPRADNNWRGGPNRGGWSNPEYDRLVDAFSTTLEPSERAAEVAQMARVFGQDLPMLSLFFLSVPYAWVSNLHGPSAVAPEAWPVWNLPEWQFKQ
ncbi:MAG TPA: ABC transporter substrate-binding protein, partial [Chloroflexota bacterium]